jgi:hypothetical protein
MVERRTTAVMRGDGVKGKPCLIDRNLSLRPGETAATVYSGVLRESAIEAGAAIKANQDTRGTPNEHHGTRAPRAGKRGIPGSE